MKKALISSVVLGLMALALLLVLSKEFSPGFKIEAIPGEDFTLMFRIKNQDRPILFSEDKLPSSLAKVRLFTLPHLDEIPPRQPDPSEVRLLVPGHRGLSSIEWKYNSEITDEFSLKYLFPQLPELASKFDVLVVWVFPVKDEQGNTLLISYGSCLLSNTSNSLKVYGKILPQ
jgi:hypothetical protein